MKVGIYTLHACFNYGAMLQAYATQRVINSFGTDAEIVNLYMNNDAARNPYIEKVHSLKDFVKDIYAIVNPQVWKKCANFRKFHDAMPLSKPYYSLDEIYTNPPVYDVHVVGSDQTWNLDRGFHKQNFFYLDFLKGNETRISYAPSFGNPNVPVSLYPQLKQLLSKFSAVSTREKGGVELIKKAAGIDAALVLDPTLLLTSTQWKSIISDKPIIKGEYIASYDFSNSEDIANIYKSLRKALNMPIVAMSVSTFIPYKVDKFVQSAGPLEFLNILYHAKYVLTGSFHGLAFAVNFKKDFVVIRQGKRMARMESLLDIMGLKERIVATEQELKNLLEKNTHVDFSKGTAQLEQMRTQSIDWLKKALKMI